ncbi:MAG: phosphate acyltransferase PlsX [Planctomycetales bacterium]|jgi:glycerol-3-phosphate acyltransferase PlsX|nr:phosphate acyltransferase PlsX [Planctomycetales bacterium]
MRIALDAMGGDFGVQPNIDGAITALKDNPDLHVTLVGDLSSIGPLVAKSGYPIDRLHLHASEGYVEMGEKPIEALRQKPNCSIVVCWQLMATQQVDAVVSAGHTGAVVAAGLRTRLFLKGVKRPGIAVALPTTKGKTILMDVGANPGARPEHLVQYGVMGSVYSREMFGIERPTVGLMNIGSEDGKGTDVLRESHTLFSQSPFRDQFIGNIEGRELYTGAADVVICEGFVGNVLLKAAEGLADMMMKTVAAEVIGALNVERGLATQAFQSLAKRFEYHEAGGAPLLGVEGLSIICHGASTARSIHNALRLATTLKARRINEQIVDLLSQNP